MTLPLNKIILGDCVEVMRGFPENSIDCIVTDPPYGLSFMSKHWDRALPPKQAFVEMHRVLKPGALAFVMSSPRQDLMWRMAQMLEESGFELGQSFISWVYASGFPKAYDVSNAIDKKMGFEREVIGIESAIPTRPITNNWKKSRNIKPTNRSMFETAPGSLREITTPTSPEAKQWSGWKSVTGLKPALEVIFMAQKPLSEKTIVDNVLKHGVGAINVDSCRIPIETEVLKSQNRGGFVNTYEASKDNLGAGDEYIPNSQGRFPANLLVSDDALNNGKISTSVGGRTIRGKNDKVGSWGFQDFNTQGYGDSGSFSRYFDLDAWAEHHGFLNVPKADTAEREYGLYLGDKEVPKSKFNLSNGEKEERFDGAPLSKRRNVHPTVKPVKLMAYLIELGCPPNGVVLDPFLGSGTTCVAAKQLRRRYIGIEIEENSHRIAESRVSAYPDPLDWIGDSS